MRFTRTCAALITLAMVGSVATSASAQRRGDAGKGGRGDGGKWEELGCVEVGRRNETDVIKVGRGEGRFKAIRLHVARRDIHINNLSVVYADGTPDRLAVNKDVADGNSSPPLDLEGWARAIERIELSARKGANEGRGRAEVCVQGLRASRDEVERFRNGPPPGMVGRPGPGPGYGGPPPRGPERGVWHELGCERAGFLPDRDVIQIGRKEGRYRAVRLAVQGNRVDVKDLHVFYANGENEHLPVQREIREGDRSQTLDLAGDRRVIDRVELVYSSKPSLKGQARVCVEGLE